jgi:hypothetical protein
MATLLSRVRAITGSTTTQTADASVVSFILSGVKFVITSLPKELQWAFSIQGNSITDANGFRVGNDTVLDVSRDGYTCKEIPSDLSYAQKSAHSASSLYAGTSIFPVYIKKDGLVYIYPVPTALKVGRVTYVALPTVTTTTDDTDSSWYFKLVDPAIIWYASGLDYQGVGSHWRKQAETLLAAVGSALVYTNVEDALTKAQNLIDNLGSTDFEDFIGSSQEDTEMAQTVVQGASQEVNRAGQELAKIRTQLEENGVDVTAASQFLQNSASAYGESAKCFEKAKIELDQYITHNSRIIKATGEVK